MALFDFLLRHLGTYRRTGSPSTENNPSDSSNAVPSHHPYHQCETPKRSLLRLLPTPSSEPALRSSTLVAADSPAAPASRTAAARPHPVSRKSKVKLGEKKRRTTARYHSSQSPTAQHAASASRSAHSSLARKIRSPLSFEGQLGPRVSGNAMKTPKQRPLLATNSSPLSKAARVHLPTSARLFPTSPLCSKAAKTISYGPSLARHCALRSPTPLFPGAWPKEQTECESTPKATAVQSARDGRLDGESFFLYPSPQWSTVFPALSASPVTIRKRKQGGPSEVRHSAKRLRSVSPTISSIGTSDTFEPFSFLQHGKRRRAASPDAGVKHARHGAPTASPARLATPTGHMERLLAVTPIPPIIGTLRDRRLRTQRSTQTLRGHNLRFGTGNPAQPPTVDHGPSARRGARRSNDLNFTREFYRSVETTQETTTLRHSLIPDEGMEPSARRKHELDGFTASRSLQDWPVLPDVALDQFEPILGSRLGGGSLTDLSPASPDLKPASEGGIDACSAGPSPLPESGVLFGFSLDLDYGRGSLRSILDEAKAALAEYTPDYDGSTKHARAIAQPVTDPTLFLPLMSHSLVKQEIDAANDDILAQLFGSAIENRVFANGFTKVEEGQSVKRARSFLTDIKPYSFGDSSTVTFGRKRESSVGVRPLWADSEQNKAGQAVESDTESFGLAWSKHEEIESLAPTTPECDELNADCTDSSGSGAVVATLPKVSFAGFKFDFGSFQNSPPASRSLAHAVTATRKPAAELSVGEQTDMSDNRLAARGSKEHMESASSRLSCPTQTKGADDGDEESQDFPGVLVLPRDQSLLAVEAGIISANKPSFAFSLPQEERPSLRRPPTFKRIDLSSASYLRLARDAQDEKMFLKYRHAAGPERSRYRPVRYPAAIPAEFAICRAPAQPCRPSTIGRSPLFRKLFEWDAHFAALRNAHNPRKAISLALDELDPMAHRYWNSSSPRYQKLAAIWWNEMQIHQVGLFLPPIPEEDGEGYGVDNEKWNSPHNLGALHYLSLRQNVIDGSRPVGGYYRGRWVVYGKHGPYYANLSVEYAAPDGEDIVKIKRRDRRRKAQQAREAEAHRNLSQQAKGGTACLVDLPTTPRMSSGEKDRAIVRLRRLGIERPKDANVEFIWARGQADDVQTEEDDHDLGIEVVVGVPVNDIEMVDQDEEDMNSVWDEEEDIDVDADWLQVLEEEDLAVESRSTDDIPEKQPITESVRPGSSVLR